MQFGCIYFHIFIIIDKHFILSYLSSVSSTVHVTSTINHGYLLHTDVLRRSSSHDVASRRLNSVFFMQGIYFYLQIDSTQGKQLLLNGIYFLIICTIFSICTKSEKMIKMQYFQEFFFFVCLIIPIQAIILDNDFVEKKMSLHQCSSFVTSWHRFHLVYISCVWSLCKIVSFLVKYILKN